MIPFSGKISFAGSRDAFEQYNFHSGTPLPVKDGHEIINPAALITIMLFEKEFNAQFN